MDSPSAWTVQSNLTQTKARRKKIGSEKKLHQKMRRLKAQLMGMVSGISQKPHDSINLSDSATFMEDAVGVYMYISEKTFMEETVAANASLSRTRSKTAVASLTKWITLDAWSAWTPLMDCSSNSTLPMLQVMCCGWTTRTSGRGPCESV